MLHNSVLRAAKYYNGGFVMEQEGDSFTIAFYDPFDAVVFCLQVRHTRHQTHVAALAHFLLFDLAAVLCVLPVVLARGWLVARELSWGVAAHAAAALLLCL